MTLNYNCRKLMSIEFHITEKWKSLFQKNQLETFEDFFKDDKRFKLVAEEKSTSEYKFTCAL